MNDGNIPVLSVRAKCLAKAWELSLLSLYEHGCEIPTQYDGEGDRRSKDCTMIVTVEDPLSDPMIHRAFPGGLEDLEEYRQEVVDGIKDHWVRDPNDPDDTRWEYTYHERLTKYVGAVPVVVPRREYKPVVIDQLADAVNKLAECPYTRRVQAVTWMPWCDPNCYDPPCLQSIWLRIAEDKSGVWWLNMNVRLRSRDAYDAAFMNMFAFIMLQIDLCDRIGLQANREVLPGRYCDISDSYHIYGSRLDHFEQNFLKLVNEREFEDRTWPLEFATPIFEEAKPRIAEKVRKVDSEREARA